MLYYDLYTYKSWQFLILASDFGLRSIDLYDNQDLSSYMKLDIKTRVFKDALNNYFKGIPFPSDLKLDLLGTDFQKKVWQALLTIPFGKTRSYKDIAQAIGSPKAYQAVGNAVGKNPILVCVPCHRIITADGHLGGFSSDIQLKIELLNLEGSSFIWKRVMIFI